MLFWKAAFGKYFLTYITPAMIAEKRDELLQIITRRHTAISPSTVNRYLAALSKAFTICIKELGWLTDNPTLLISRPKENKPRERYLTIEEISRLLNICRYSKSPSLYPVVAFALVTGARKGEILNLKWEDVDLKQQIAIFRSTKNGETRSVALTPHLVECLIKVGSQRLVSSAYIFPSQNGKNPADIESAWDYAVQRANLSNLRFHDLRHTAASHLAMMGASTLEIAAVLGHKTLAMVKRYSHLSTSATAQIVKRLNDAIFGKEI